MRKIKLYIATSLDGFIAAKDGTLEWLTSFPPPENTEKDYGYATFFNSIDTTLTGNNTYKQVLSFNEPFNPGKTNYVFTRSKDEADTEQIKYIHSDIPAFVHALKTAPGQDIWLVGGAQLNTLFLQHHLIDEMILHIMPVVIGEGIPLFAGLSTPTRLRLTSSKTYENGVLGLTYVR